MECCNPLKYNEIHFLDTLPLNCFTHKIIGMHLYNDGKSIDTKFICCLSELTKDILIKYLIGILKESISIDHKINEIYKLLNLDPYWRPSLPPYEELYYVKKYAYKLGYLSEYRHYMFWKWGEAWQNGLVSNLEKLRASKLWEDAVVKGKDLF